MPGSAVRYGPLDYPVANENGQIAFKGSVELSGGEIIEAMFADFDRNGGLLVAQAGELANSSSIHRFADGYDFRDPFFDVFDQPVLGEAGHLAFGARLAASDLSPTYPTDHHGAYGLWTSSGKQPELVVMTGEPIPGASDGSLFTAAHQDGAGFSQLRPFAKPAVDRFGLTSFVAHTHVPGSPSNLPGNASAFLDQRPAIWRQRPDGTLSMEFEPSSIPVSTPGASRYILDIGDIALRPDGISAYVERPGYLRDDPPTALFTHSTESAKQFVSALQSSAPGLGDGHVFVRDSYTMYDYEVFSRLAATRRSGYVAFQGHAQSSGQQGNGQPSVRQGIWAKGPNSELRAVAYERQQAPGVELEGAYFKPTFESFTLGESGLVAFVGDVGRFAHRDAWSYHSDIGSGIWAEVAGEGLQLVVQEGQSAPGLGDSTVFGSFIEWSIGARCNETPELLDFNAAGQLAFSALLRSDNESSNSSDAETRRSIWVRGHDGALQMIVREGDAFDVSNDPLEADLRTIASLRRKEHCSFWDPRSFEINDLGEVVFWAEFTDGTSGVFVSSLVAVPEPSTAFLAVIALALSSSRTRFTLRRR